MVCKTGITAVFIELTSSRRMDAWEVRGMKPGGLPGC